MGSPTPKPIVNQQQEPATITVAQTQPIITTTAILQKQTSNGVSEVKSEPSPVVAQPPVVLPMIVARPISPIGESLPQVDESKEFEVPSAATTPPLVEPELPVEQSPRARALAEALFGKDQATPSGSPLRPKPPSTEELRDEVEKKAMAATVALKNSSLYVEGSSPLRRKSTKRIDLQKISGPHLVSASMSVDAIPLASPSMASLGSPDAPKGGSKLGDKLRRLRGSLRNKPQLAPSHSKESSTASTVIYEQPSGEQVVNYDPHALNQPQIRSGPAHSGMDPAATAAIKSPAGSSIIVSPPATAGPAGLKGFMARLRQPKHAARNSRDFGTPTRSAVSIQPSASLSSSQLNEPTFTPLAVPSALPSTTQSTQASVTSSPAQTPDEMALEQLFAAAHNLGLNPADLNDLLQRSGSQTAKLAASSSRPGTGTRRYEDASSMAWTNDQPSAAPSRQPSIRLKAEAVPRARPIREGNNPVSGVVRRTIIYPSTAAPTSASPLPSQSRTPSVHQKTASSIFSKRRPMSMQSQVSGRSVHGRIPTPPPSRGAARRLSEDGHAPPVPSSVYTASNGRPSTSAGILYVTFSWLML
jgi:serine/arginine repetitive matrix protein 2